MSRRQVNELAAPGVAPVWLSVVGLGDSGLASIGARARAVIEAGDVLFGGERHLALIGEHPGDCRAWRTPLSTSLDEIEALRGRSKVVVLASGDPMCFGIGAALCRRFAMEEMQVLPVASAFSLAAARLGWPLQDVVTLSLHNREPSTIRRHVQPDVKLLALTRDGDTPSTVAGMLSAMGYGQSRMVVFEHLDGEKERRIERTAASWNGETVAALNTLAIDCQPDPSAAIHPSAPGLDDEAFEHDGMLTKREIRAITLARLMPLAGQRLWDVGAGSGAIGIEWLRSSKNGSAVAIERDETRADRAAANAERLGTPELQIVKAEAPGCFDNLETPDAIFIGGGITSKAMLSEAWGRLPPGGRLVANVVTLDGERHLLDWQVDHGGDLIRLAISRAERIGPYQGWRPAMPVTQYAGVKS